MQTEPARPSPRTLLAFFPLAFLLSWYPFLVKLAGGPGSGGINPLGPLVAALIMTAVEGGWRGLGAYLRRAFQLRVGLGWYAGVVALPIVLAAAATLVNLAAGAPVPGAAQLAGWREVPVRFVFILLFIGLGEEMGWRGFALQRLRARFAPLGASGVLGAVWAAWHFPLTRTELKPEFIAPFVVGILAATVLSTFIYDRTRGSVAPQMIFHATVNTMGAGYLFRFAAGADLTRLWWIYAALWAGTASVIAWRARMWVPRVPARAETAAVARAAGPVPT